MEIDKDNLPFSKRYGFEPVEIPFQTDDIDHILRTELWNAFYLFIYRRLENAENYSKGTYRSLHQFIWVDFFKKALDDFPGYDYEFRNFIRQNIEKGTWYKVYEFFEFVFSNIEDGHTYQNLEFEDYINTKLRANNSAYTLTGNKFIPVTNEAEINELKQTQSSAEQYGLTGIQEHLNSAIELLSQKPKPDFRNSIKESISMVEVISRIIEPTENTLGKALNKLDKHQKISGTLKAGFEKLYAYTNDKNGIRHALMDEQTVDFEDAKFFLIACSAFTNYLIEKAKKDNLLNTKKQ
jgi:hypothetical protein